MKIKDLKNGAAVKLTKLTKESKETRPPNRYSENGLVAKLEELGIGRPSTFSSIVSVIQERGYVKKKGNQLYPTARGFAIARIMGDKLTEFTAYAYTSDMEQRLEEIEEGKVSREQFLADFWRGKDGFEALLSSLENSIDFDELRDLATIDLGNGYRVKFSRYGTFLEDSNGEANEKGYLPSAKLDDEVDIWDYKDPEVAAEAMKSAAVRAEGPRVLGLLPGGQYQGWTVHAREGKFGAYVQAIHPDEVIARDAGKKPSASTPAAVSQKLPEGVDLATVELKDVAELFAEVKLPRWSPDKKWLVGIGKRGAYMGMKKTAKSRPVFKSLPEDVDPRTVSFDAVKKLWEEAEKK